MRSVPAILPRIEMGRSPQASPTPASRLPDGPRTRRATRAMRVRKGCSFAHAAHCGVHLRRAAAAHARPPCVPAASPPHGADERARETAKPAIANALLDAYLTPGEQLDFIAQMLEIDVQRGDVVIRQGEKGNNFFLIAHGECTVSVDGKPVRTLTTGANCGELSLLENTPRTVSVIVRRAPSGELHTALALKNGRSFGPLAAQLPLRSPCAPAEPHRLSAGELGPREAASHAPHSFHEVARQPDGHEAQADPAFP